jgi:hypothetical protein
VWTIKEKEKNDNMSEDNFIVSADKTLSDKIMLAVGNMSDFIMLLADIMSYADNTLKC